MNPKWAETCAARWDVAKSEAERMYEAIKRRAESYGVRVKEEHLGPEKPGVFDGPSATMNADYPPTERSFYLAHAIGSIVHWALHPDESRRTFDELRAARKQRDSDPERLENAIAAYREFEGVASEYAVWLLADLGFADAVPAYTNFFRADMESMVLSQRDGAAPPWPDFFAEWNREVACGEREVRPYEPRPIPPFQPVPMKTMEVVQEQDGRP